MTVSAKIVNLGNIDSDVLVVTQKPNYKGVRLARGASTFVSAHKGEPVVLESEHGNGDYRGDLHILVLEAGIPDLHPAVMQVLGHFSYDHLRHGYLKEVSKVFAEVACHLVKVTPSGPEVTVGLRKLLEAKDCFVRANVKPGH